MVVGDELQTAPPALGDVSALLIGHLEEHGHGRGGVQAAELPRGRPPDADLDLGHERGLDVRRHARTQRTGNCEVGKTPFWLWSNLL